MTAQGIEQNQLGEGAQVDLLVEGARLTVTATRKRRYQLEALLAEMPDEWPRVEGWDEMRPVGN